MTPKHRITVTAAALICLTMFSSTIYAATGAQVLTALSERVDKPRYFRNLLELLQHQKIDLSKTIPDSVFTKAQSIKKPGAGGSLSDTDKETLKEVLQRLADETPVIKGLVAGITKTYFLIGPQPLGADPIAVFALDDPTKQHSKDDLHKLAHWFLTTQPEAGFKTALTAHRNLGANLVRSLPAP